MTGRASLSADIKVSSSFLRLCMTRSLRDPKQPLVSGGAPAHPLAVSLGVLGLFSARTSLPPSLFLSLRLLPLSASSHSSPPSPHPSAGLVVDWWKSARQGGGGVKLGEWVICNRPQVPDWTYVRLVPSSTKSRDSTGSEEVPGRSCRGSRLFPVSVHWPTF